MSHDDERGLKDRLTQVVQPLKFPPVDVVAAEDRGRTRRRHRRALTVGASCLLVAAVAVPLLTLLPLADQPQLPARLEPTSSNGVIWVRVGGGDGPSFVYRVDPASGRSTALFNDGEQLETGILPGEPNSHAVGQQYAWSPDGARLVFADGSGYGTELFEMDAAGKARTRLTHDDGLASFPAWSPDGSKIAYASDTTPPTSGRYYTPGCEISMTMCPSNIKVIGTDGEGSRQLTHDPTGATMPDWSPDGSRIVFIRAAGASRFGDVAVMDADGSHVQALTSGAADDVLPRWSPDGTKIAFIRSEGHDPFELWMMNSDGAGLRQITHLDSTTVGSFAWSPDSTQIAYDTGGGDHGGRLFFLTATGTQVGSIEVAAHYDIGDLAWRPVPPPTTFDPLRPAPRACPSHTSERSGGDPAQLGERLAGNLPTWLPNGFGLQRSNGLPGHTPFGIWTDAACREVQFVRIRGVMGNSAVALHVRPVGSWLGLLDAPGGCPTGSDTCFDYKAFAGNYTLLLETRGLPRSQADRVAISIPTADPSNPGPSPYTDPRDGVSIGVLPGWTLLDDPPSHITEPLTVFALSNRPIPGVNPCEWLSALPSDGAVIWVEDWLHPEQSGGQLSDWPPKPASLTIAGVTPDHEDCAAPEARAEDVYTVPFKVGGAYLWAEVGIGHDISDATRAQIDDTLTSITKDG